MRKGVILLVKIHLSRILGEKRMSQKELSEKTGIRRATINEMYHELVERINLDYLSKMCEVLNVKIEDILEYIPDKNTKL
ncbi:helix-turn-helix domain-containing protein [Criibacterium bergeronii]|uniref:helix-turn-helix domain-containing protein n=1 Tax=Criibacterium bergeronii TaxID=1871336 RepID=UPI002ED534C4